MTTISQKEIAKDKFKKMGAIVKNRPVKSKKIDNPTNTAWVYDEELGWININLFLKNVKMIEKKLNSRLKKTG